MEEALSLAVCAGSWKPCTGEIKRGAHKALGFYSSALLRFKEKSLYLKYSPLKRFRIITYLKLNIRRINLTLNTLVYCHNRYKFTFCAPNNVTKSYIACHSSNGIKNVLYIVWIRETAAQIFQRFGKCGCLRARPQPPLLLFHWWGMGDNATTMQKRVLHQRCAAPAARPTHWCERSCVHGHRGGCTWWEPNDIMPGLKEQQQLVFTIGKSCKGEKKCSSCFLWNICPHLK